MNILRSRIVRIPQQLVKRNQYQHHRISINLFSSTSDSNSNDSSSSSSGSNNKSGKDEDPKSSNVNSNGGKNKKKVKNYKNRKRLNSKNSNKKKLNGTNDDSGSNVIELSGKLTKFDNYNAPTPKTSLVIPAQRPIFPGFLGIVSVKNDELNMELEKLVHPNNYVTVLRTDFEENDINENRIEFQEIDFGKIGTFCKIQKIDPVYASIQPSSRRRNIPPEAEEEKMLTGWSVLIYGCRRVVIEKLITSEQPLYAEISHVKESSHDRDLEDVQPYVNETMTVIKTIMNTSPTLVEAMNQSYLPYLSQRDIGKISDFLATISAASPEKLQKVLEILNGKDRICEVLEIWREESRKHETQLEFAKQVEEKMNTAHRKHLLRQQLKLIQEELGQNKDDKRVLMEAFDIKLAKLLEIGKENNVAMPDDALKVIEEEINKLASLDQDSSEFNNTRRYLEWLTYVPWTIFSKDNYEILKAYNILKDDHYGLEDVKERILEYIAVGNLKGEIKGKILLLVGPPGVGKTSIGKSIASALGREFYRFSVGGLSDVSEIKGHRRTYIGAMPGKIIQCLKQAQTMNPLILIDEIDKLDHGHRGDPASALLELLDPSQNTSFLDHYLDVPVNVSKVLFVCTANMTDSIPAPLLDRMEILRLSGYDLPEKVKIARDYLVPRAKKEAGLLLESAVEVEKEKEDLGADTKKSEKSNKEEEEIKSKKTVKKESKKKTEPRTELKVNVDVKVGDEALESLSRWYCREAGVRKLQQLVERIYRKVAFMIVKKNSNVSLPELTSLSRTKPKEIVLPESGEYVITESDLESFVGKRVFESDRLYEEEIPPGVVMGLAWSAYGGSSLYIETTNVKKTSNPKVTTDKKTQPLKAGSMLLTGKLGEVMKESATISYTNAKHLLQEFDPDNEFFDQNDIHLHVPEGATPKDGPSAGVTMTTALLSLAMNKPVSSDLAMTGEISLTGKVLPVGGIKEKIIAARRSGVHHIALPDLNRKDVDELPDYLKEDLKIEFAKTYHDVYKVAFTN